jgi:HEAT repeat protein
LEQIEDTYRTSTTLRDKIKAMRKLVNSEDQQAVLTVGRMFHEEKDVQMREEFLELLLDMPGKETDKLSVLATAIAPSQPLSVRELAIDIMVDLGSKNAIPVLETLLKDPSTSLREYAQDAIKEITNPTPPSTMSDKDDGNDDE